MADKKASITNIPLNGSLNLNRFEGDIQNYSGFHQDNSIYLGGIKQGLYKSSISIPEDQTLITSYKGNIYTYKKGGSGFDILKNGEKIHSVKDRKYAEHFPLVPEDDDVYITKTDANYTYLFIKGYGSAIPVSGVYSSVIYGDYSYNNGRMYFITLFNEDQFNKPSEMQSFAVYTYNTGAQRFDTIKVNDGGEKNVKFACYGNQVLLFTDTTAYTMNMKRSENPWDKITVDSSLRTITFNVVWNQNSDSRGKVDTTTQIECIPNEYYCELYKHIKQNNVMVECWALFFDNIGIQNDSWMSIPVDSSGRWHNGLIARLNASDFYVLYYNGTIRGISGNGKIISRADSIIAIGGNTVIFKINGQIKEIWEEPSYNTLPFNVVDNILIFNTSSIKNAIDMDTDTPFCSCPDYNGRLIPFMKDTEATRLDKPVPLMYGTGFNEQAWRNNYQYLASIYPSYEFQTFYPYEKYSYAFENVVWADDGSQTYLADPSINIYWGEGSDQPAIYYNTRISSIALKKNTDLITSYFPDYDNIVSTVALMDTVKTTNLGSYVISNGKNSYISVSTSANKPMLAYYELSQTEFDNLFNLHNSYYADNGQYLESVSIENGILRSASTIANKNDLQFIGNTLQMALYYSPVDRSIYSFTGDVTFNKYIESTRITDISAMFCEPSKNIIFLGTNDGTIIYYDNQLIRLTDETSPKRIYYDNGVFIIDNHMYSFNEREGFERMPVEFESEYYSSDVTLEEVNDCVYIRLFDENPKEGTFEISCGTMTETSVDSISKTFHVKPSMFDSNHVLKLRYQPRLQRGAFKFKVKSDYPIASISISHKPNNVSNATYNL